MKLVVMTLMPILLLLVRLHNAEGSIAYHQKRLRDTSFAIGVDLDRTPDITTTIYDKSKYCQAQTSCSTLLPNVTVTTNHSICIAMGDAAVTQNGNLFNGILCPPLDYDLLYVKNIKSHSFELSANNDTVTTSAVRQPIIIHSAEEETEIIGLFDSIMPKQAYVLRYDSPTHASCSFHPSSNGDSDSLANNSIVCYDAEKKGLMLQSEVEDPNCSRKCLDFYWIVDDTMSQYAIVKNQTLIDLSASVTEPVYSWPFINPQMCQPSYSSSASKPAIITIPMLLLILSLTVSI